MLLPLLLCVLIAYAPPPGQPVLSWPLAAAGVALLAAVNAAASWAASGLALRIARQRPPGADWGTGRLLTLLKGGLIGFTLADVFALKWPLAVEGLLGRHRWAVVIDDVLLLLPVVVMILTVMAFWHRVRSRTGQVGLSLPRHLWLRFRVEMGIILAPWLVLVVVTDLAEAAFRGTPHAELAGTLSLGGAFLVLIVFSPALLRALWTASPMPPGPLRERLEEFCRRSRFRCRDILIWHTHNHLANAGVVGPTPLLRYVVISDALVNHCSEEEIEAIFAHEVGHIRHYHLAFYMVVALAFLGFYVNLVDLLAAVGWVEPMGSVLGLEMTANQALVMLMFAGVYWVLFFGMISRRMEQQADLYSISTIEEPEAFLTALMKLAGISHTPVHTSFWRHFSIARRLGFLRQVLAEPRRIGLFRLKIAALQLGVIALFALALLRLILTRPSLLGA